MKRLASFTAAGLILGLGTAFAADLAPAPAPVPMYVKAPYMAPPTWAGFYLGGNAGWVGSANNDINLSGSDTGPSGLGSMLAAGVIPSTINLGDSGFLGGGQLGYNWQFGSWVLGLEGDLDWANAKSSVTVPDVALKPLPVGLVTPLTTNASRELDWLGTIRGRIGYTPVAPLLIYGTGGLAVGEHKLGIGVSDPGANPPANLFNQTSDTSVGWTVGAGFEWMFASHWSVKAEYLYVDLGNISSTVNYAYGTNTSSLTGTLHETDNIARGGINYHF
jgi:outer membrane immunogenic protein